VRRRKLLWILPATVVALAAVALALWLTPSGDYLFLPGEAVPVAPLVKIEDQERAAGPGGDGIYMVDISVRKANLLERLFPSLQDGATLVPGDRLNPIGVSEQQRTRSSRLDMTRSQQIAAAVALESLGYDVQATPNGAEISLVVPDAPAAGKLQPGDVIVEANGTPVKTPGDLRGAMASVEPGDDVTIAYRRSGGRTEVALGTRAAQDDPSRAVIGVLVQQAATIDLPVPISIDAGPIGGPSAGLAFALDIVDELGADVDRGRRIVVTGQLGLDGTVTPIGGVKQKVIGAEAVGADVFVVPEGNAAEARQYADGIDIVPVGTFDEALADLGAAAVTD
jgi:PDZ domain-containing protein